MKLPKLLKYHLTRISLAFLLSLLAIVHAQAEVPRYQLAVEKMGEYTILNQTETIDKYLDKIGFGPRLRNSITNWKSQPVIAKIEHAYWYAEAAQKDSGKEAIARLSVEIAKDWPVLANHSEIVELVEAELSERALKFQRPASEIAMLPSRFHEPVLTLSSYVADGSHVTAEALLRRAGADTETIYKSLRSSRTTKGALMTYLATMKDVSLIEDKVRIMTDFIAQTFPSARNEAHLKPFMPPDIRDPFHPPPGPGTGPGQGPRTASDLGRGAGPGVDPGAGPGTGPGAGSRTGPRPGPRPGPRTGPGTGPRTSKGVPKLPGGGCRARR